jgi:two-component system sensor histidine kinase KdpD
MGKENAEKGTGGFEESEQAQEHILVCLSSSPTNERLIRKAAGLSAAFRGSLSALYVQLPGGDARMSAEDRRRLEHNERLAQSLGAKLEIVHGEDIAYSIAEYARASGTTKIVIGRSSDAGAHRGSRKLIDTLVAFAPDVDVYIIPDKRHEVSRGLRLPLVRSVQVRISDFFFAAGMLLLASAIGWLFKMADGSESNIVVLYIFFVFLISVRTASWIWSLCAAAASVIIYNYLFTAPEFTLYAYDNRYTVSFGVMFFIALFTGVMAARLRLQARNSAAMAYRIGIQYDMSQLLEKCRDEKEILEVTAGQLVKLLHRNVALYPRSGGGLTDPEIFLNDPAQEWDFRTEGGEKNEAGQVRAAQTQAAAQTEHIRSGNPAAGIEPGHVHSIRAENSRKTEAPAKISLENMRAAQWSFDNGQKAGRGTKVFSDAQCTFLAIRQNSVVYGVVGIDTENSGLDPYEESFLISILGEAAIALENKRNEAEKEEARLLAKNEQLRANLLRSISHDLRTPLTSISGTASILMSEESRIDEASRHALYTNIYDDAMWLEDLVENLLSITRLEEGRMRIRTSTELVGEVMEEAARHCSRKLTEHVFAVHQPSDLLLARMDARLIMQVLINLINNAVKYTPAGSHIDVYAQQEGRMIRLSVTDDGPGVAPEDQAHIFEMFYNGKKTVADSSRSIGLGLFLCKIIVQAHGGEITYKDNKPHGSVFTFTLPATEVENL